MLSVNIKVRKARAAELEQFKKEAERFFMLRKRKHRKQGHQGYDRDATHITEWTKLGSGFYSEAWVHEAYPDYVMKLGGSASWGYDFLDLGEVGVADPWPLYAEYCTKVSGTHIPEVYHVVKPSESSALFWAVMPRYTSHHDLNRHKTEQLSATRDSIFADMEKFPKWFSNVYKYVSAKADVSIDIHMGNIMYDNVNQRAVVTDPFSSTGF